MSRSRGSRKNRKRASSSGQDQVPASLRPVFVPEAGQPVLTESSIESDGGPSIHQTFMMQEQHWQGPLPPPAMLAEFNDIEPGLAGRIVKMAEEEGAHVRRMEWTHLWLAAGSRYLGQIAGFILVGICLWVGYKLATQGLTGSAAIVFGTTIATVVGAFVLGRRRTPADSNAKNTPASSKAKNDSSRKN